MGRSLAGAATPADDSSTSSSGQTSVGTAASQVAPGAQAAAQSGAAASALGAQAVAPATSANEVVAAARPADLAGSADRLMGQVVRTINTYQTAGGPTVEARISDPNLGDVKLIVTGRAGEVIQAQLVVKDRVSAEALTAAAARAHASGDGLAGVNVTVRSETGGWTSGGRSGSSDAAAWAANGSGTGSGSERGDGQGAAAGQTGSGSSNGFGAGTGSPSDSSRGSNRPAASPFDQTTAGDTGRGRSRLPLRSGSSLDIRA